MPAKNPAPSRHQVLTFLSPDIRDILFYELKDARIPSYAKGQPEYGDAHPDKAKWPDHELVYISPDDETGFERWYYAVAPKDQDDHNYTKVHPFGGLPWAYQIKRVYFLKREGYVALAKGTLDSADDKAYLTEEVQQKTGVEQLDSLYVLSIRTFTRYVAEEVRESNVCMVIFSPRVPIVTEGAPEDAFKRLPTPEILGSGFVLAAQLPMDQSGEIFSFQDGKLVNEA